MRVVNLVPKFAERIRCRPRRTLLAHRCRGHLYGSSILTYSDLVNCSPFVAGEDMVQSPRALRRRATCRLSVSLREYQVGRFNKTHPSDRIVE